MQGFSFAGFPILRAAFFVVLYLLFSFASNVHAQTCKELFGAFVKLCMFFTYVVITIYYMFMCIPHDQQAGETDEIQSRSNMKK